MNKTITIIIAAFFLFISCDKEVTIDSTFISHEGNPVFVFSSMNKPPVIKECDSDGRIVLQGHYNSLSVGSIICSGPTENAPYGFFARVREINVKGGDTYIETELASLDEVIKEGEASIDCSIAELFDSVEDGDGVVVKSGATRLDMNSGLELPINIKIANVDGVDITFSGTFSLKGTIHTDMSFYDWELLKFEFWGQVESDLKLDVDAKAQKPIPLFEKPLFKIKLRPITFIVHGIPVVIVPIIEVKIKTKIDGSITLGCELLKVNYKYKAGAAYIKGDGWSLIKDSSCTPPTLLNDWKAFDMKGGLTVDFANNVIPAFYGYDPSWDPKHRVLYNINISAPIKIQLSDFDAIDLIEGYFNPRLTASWGIDVGAEFKLKILSKRIADFSPKVKLFETVVIDKHLFPRYSEAKTTVVGEGLARLSYSMIDLDDCLFTDLRGYGVYWKKGKWPNNLKDGTEHRENLGSVDLESVMPFASDRHFDFDIILDRLEPNAIYTVWPYCVDQFSGTEHSANISQFKIGKDEDSLKKKLMDFYFDTDGPHWKNNTNWCSDKPLDEWYGLSYDSQGLSMEFINNGLKGDGHLENTPQLKTIIINEPELCLYADNCDRLSFPLFDPTPSLSGGSKIYDIKGLSVTNCTNLKEIEISPIHMLFCRASGCDSLEYFCVEDCPSLQELDLSSCNQLHSLTIHGCIALKSLNIDNSRNLLHIEILETGLERLSLSNLPVLEELDIFINPYFSSLVCSNLPSLGYLRCAQGILTEFSFKDCPSLWYLDCHDNCLTHLDLPESSSIQMFFCERNNITQMIPEGWEHLFPLKIFDVCDIDDDPLNLNYDPLYFYYRDTPKIIDGIQYSIFYVDKGHGWYRSDEPYYKRAQ